MDVLPRLKLLNALTAVAPPAVTLVRSFTAKGMYLHEPVQGLNLNRRPITGLEPVMPVTTQNTLRPILDNFQYQIAYNLSLLSPKIILIALLGFMNACFMS
jgi:hypothetical protein